jgi:putative MATE family efflux protein
MRDFTKGNVLRQLFVFSLPIVAGNLLLSLYNVIDAMWVGKIIGYEGLAAVSASTPLVFFLVSLIIGVSISTNILVAQAYGAKSMEGLSKVLINSFIIIMVAGVIVSLASIKFSRLILDIVNTPESIKDNAHTYIVIILSGLIFTIAYNWFSVVLRGLGDSVTPLKLLLVSVILNVILTPILIIGVGPIPRLGIAGSALGTVLSTFFAMVGGYLYLIKRNHFLDMKKWKFKIDIDTIKKIFTIGIPASMHIILISLSGVVIISLVNRFGPEVTAAYGIGLRLDMFAFLSVFSIGLAVTSMVAQNLGASTHQRVPQILKWSIMLSLCFSTVFFIVVNLLPAAIASIFTRNQAVIAYTTQYFRIVSITYLVFSFVFALGGVLRGAGDTMYQLLFTVISILVFRIPLAYMLVEYTKLKEVGIWFAITISAFVAVILNALYYFSGRWRRKAVFRGGAA